MFYVGCGSLARASGSGASRNKEWYKIVAEAGTFSVEVVAMFDNLKEARERENQEIISRRPAANFSHNPDRLRLTDESGVGKNWGGTRRGAGRKPMSEPCQCGAMSKHRASKRGHLCQTPGPSVEHGAGNNSEAKPSRLDSLFEFGA